MRVNKWGAGVVLAAAVMLTGCAAGTEKPAEEKPNETTQEESAPTTSDCPELAEGTTIEGSALGGCIADTMSETAGYAAKTTVMGMESTSRFNPSEKAIESISPAGSLIIIGEDAWVKSATGEWQVADPSSSDPIVAALSSGAEAVASMDPATAAAGLTGELTVTGKGTRLGQDVFLVSGVLEQQGVAVDTLFEVTSDYVVLATTSKTDAGGQNVEITMEITEWDVEQDIVAPL